MSIHCGLEAERLELGLDQPPHRLDPGEVHRPAVLVDPALEQGQRCAACSASTVADHCLFRRG